MRPTRLPPDHDFTALHALLTEAFAYMEGRIDPPSSLTRMTPASLAEMAQSSEVWAILDPDPIACMVLTPEPGQLYLGKLAVAARHRGEGLARRMIAHAEFRARALRLPLLTLQTRVELIENHATFTRLGFVETGRSAHPGYPRPTSITFSKLVEPSP